jgi:PGF-pre-PGF domain-containing protein
MSNVSTVNIINSSDRIHSNNLSINQDVTLEINTSSISMKVYDFSAYSTIWDYAFSVTDNSSSFESLINTNAGTVPVDYLYVQNFSKFFSTNSGYYGSVRLPSNKSAYSNLFYCGNDELDTCAIISSCSAVYTKSSSSACYNDSDNYVTIFVPHFSAVFGDNDTISPIIAITEPVNGSTVNSSYQNTLAITANEQVDCSYSIDSGSYSNIGIDSLFSISYSLYENTVYNLSLNCTDLSGNNKFLKINFTISDTTAPTFVGGIDIDETTSNMEFEFTTNEPANSTVLLVGNSTSSTTSYGTIHGYNFTSLEEDTEYDYNVTICDSLRNCYIYSDDHSTDSVSSSSTTTTTSTTTTNGGVGSGSATVQRIFIDIAAGSHTMDITSSAIAFSKLVFKTNKAVNGSSIMTVTKTVLPSSISDVSDFVYQYIKVDKTTISNTDIDNVDIFFRIENTWFEQNSVDKNSVNIYRYNNNKWDKLVLSMKGSDTVYTYYEAVSPRFSYFAISGKVVDIQVVTTDDSNGTDTGTPTGNVVDDTGGTNDNAGTTDDIDKKKNSGSGLILLIISLVVIAIIIIGVVGFFMYQKTVSPMEDQKLGQVREYVRTCKTQGLSNDQIKEALLKVGWETHLVEIVINEIHTPNQELINVMNYIKEARAQGGADSEIKRILLTAGWEEMIIDEGFEKTK